MDTAVVGLLNDVANVADLVHDFFADILNHIDCHVRDSYTCYKSLCQESTKSTNHIMEEKMRQMSTKLNEDYWNANFKYHNTLAELNAEASTLRNEVTSRVAAAATDTRADVELLKTKTESMNSDLAEKVVEADRVHKNCQLTAWIMFLGYSKKLSTYMDREAADGYTSDLAADYATFMELATRRCDDAFSTTSTVLQQRVTKNNAMLANAKWQLSELQKVGENAMLEVEKRINNFETHEGLVLAHKWVGQHEINKIAMSTALYYSYCEIEKCVPSEYANLPFLNKVCTIYQTYVNEVRRLQEIYFSD
jgi:hypothetical protein